MALVKIVNATTLQLYSKSDVCKYSRANLIGPDLRKFMKTVTDDNPFVGILVTVPYASPHYPDQSEMIDVMHAIADGPKIFVIGQYAIGLFKRGQDDPLDSLVVTDECNVWSPICLMFFFRFNPRTR